MIAVRNYIRQSQGYSLLSVLLIITMVSTIGLALLGLTSNSLKFVSANKTSVEDKAAAEMAVEEAMAKIDNMVATINTEISSNRLLMDSVKTKVQTSLDQIKSSPSYPFKIIHSTLNSREDGVYVERITINAPIGSSKRYLSKIVEVSTISDVFNYDVVSPSDLYLYGSPYIQGDVFVKNLYVSNYAKELSSWFPISLKTSHPAINGSLNVKDKYYSFTNYNGNFTEFIANEALLNQNFSLPPKIIKNQAQITKINVKEIIDSKNTLFSNKASNGSFIVKRGQKLTLYGDQTIPGDLVIDEGGELTVENGSLYVGGGGSLSGTLTFKNPADYLYITGRTYIANFSLDGQIYINNSVDILGDVNSNGTIYANSGVDFKNIFSNSGGGTLVIASEGPINVSWSYLFNKDPQTINAYLYTNSALNMDMTSNLKILGGLYGNPIQLSAIKGNWEDIFLNRKSQDSLPPEKSRLSVIYQKDLIINPPKGIPTVEQLSVKEIDQVYK